ncbi:MAG: gamma-glutamyltransferase [Chloroflexota bacterium]
MLGVIAAGHPETAAAGAKILRQGGNAVDAAIAATFASFLAESALVNIGGSGIAQIYDAQKQDAFVYDFFSSMPGLGNTSPSNHPLDFRKVLVDFGSTQQPFYIGRASVAVPGAVAGLCELLADKGTLPLSTILEPTIALAREGVHLSGIQASITKIVGPILTDTPDIRAIYAPTGDIVKAGERIYFRDLAHTLETLSLQGPGLFYTGDIAKQIVVDQQQQGGLLTETDLASYQVRKTPPINITYRGYNILLPPLSSGGGPLIAFALKLLESRPLPLLEPNSLEHLQTVIEVMRLTNVARSEWEAGENQGKQKERSINSVEDLLSETNCRRYIRYLQLALTQKEQLPDPYFPKGPASTTHLSVADANGMVVSITTSAGENAGFVVGDTGVMLNNMLGETDLHPNGFHQLPPGQRLITMMSPTLVLQQGQPILAIGSGGSSRLRSAILQTISNFLDFKLPIQAAIDAPRVHFENNMVQLEGGINPTVADQLEAGGYPVNRWSSRAMYFGGAHAVAYSRGNEAIWSAAGDPRRGGSVEIVL